MKYPKVYRRAIDKLVQQVTTPRLRVSLARAEDNGTGDEYAARAMRREIERRAES
jgi:hypothetical protein